MTATETTVQAPAGMWRLDPVHSTVGFEIQYLAGAFRGQFRDVQAQLAIADGRAALEGAAKVASVDVKDENLAAHLQSPDFFDAERHPELRFAADDVRIDGDAVFVNGEITIKDVTKPVALAGSFAPAITDAYGNERIGLKVTTSIDRTDFGVDWNMPLPTGQPALSNEVTITGDLFFVEEA
ncbi:MAG TPA: YceI family protein [Gaiellaceae bacterium]|nr:YceI family protein [Gaiellaceae bacterium]